MIAVPTNLVVSQSATDKYHQLNLSWTNNSSGEDNHRIERRRPDGQFIEIDTVATGGNSYIDSSPEIEANVIYEYRVRAYESPDYSSYSNIDSENTFSYVENFSVPVYDSENSEHFIIDSVDDFAQINNPSYRIFFIEPGNYLAAGHLIFTQSGTDENRRMFVLRDSNNPTDTTHPYFLDSADRARLLQFNISEASYIIFHRLTFEGTNRCNIVGTIGVEPESFTPSSYNIIDNCFIDEPKDEWIIIDDGCDYNTFQFNIMKGGQENSSDMVCIALFPHRNGGRNNIFEVIGTKIVYNEIFNMSDAVQLVDHLSFMTDHPTYEKTVIAYNDIYINEDIYTDGDGNFTTEGSWASSENAIDVKAASHSSAPEDWNRIIGNRMWGYRRTDPNLGGSSPGEVIVLHNLYVDEHGSDYSGWVILRENVMMDLVNGLYVEDQQHISVLNNITYDVDKKTAYHTAWCMGTHFGCTESEYYGNLYIDMADTVVTNPSEVNFCDWMYGSGRDENIDFKNNIIILGEDHSYAGGSGIVFDYNAYYDSDQASLPGTNDITYANADDSNNGVLYILRKRLTVPEIVEIPRGRTTATSPHYNSLSDDPGATTNRGVSDHKLVYTQDQNIPASPEALTATRIDNGRIDLAWSLNSTNEKNIAICRKMGVGGSYSVIKILDAQIENYSDTTVDSNTYYYKIMAVGALGGLGYSNEAQEQGEISSKRVAIRN